MKKKNCTSIYFAFILLFFYAHASFCQSQKVKCESFECEYTYFLPEQLTDSTPVIYFLDPAARGNIPIQLYKPLAEKYNVILIASNTSRNGPYDTSFKICDATIKDSKTLLEISDSNPVFISGFSGGARMAIFYASTHPEIKGVIGCGSGFPHDFNPKKLSSRYVGIIGIEDMNFLEMSILEDIFRENHSKNLVLEFNGDHSWPPLHSFEAAWQYLNPSLENEFQLTVNTWLDSVGVDNYSFILERWKKRALDLNLTFEYDSLMQAKSFKRSIKTYQKLMKEETRIFAEISGAFSAIVWTEHFVPENLKSMEWWESMRFKAQSYQKKGGQQLHLGNRIVNYITLSTMEKSFFRISAKNYQAALNYLDIHLLFSPTSIIGHFQRAICYENTGNRDEALKEIQLCVDLGLSKERIEQIIENDTYSISGALIAFLEN